MIDVVVPAQIEARIMDLIEFGRVIHAEMSAIWSARSRLADDSKTMPLPCFTARLAYQNALGWLSPVNCLN
jgi:hypothetical protein